MILKELSLFNFKNYPSIELSFDNKANCLVGNNGSGKTNLLDAIYYLAFSKSFFNTQDNQNILGQEDFFVVKGSFSLGKETEEVHCSMKRGYKKMVRRNGKNYTRFADHIGLIPLVMISPIDILLLIEGSDVRRKWIDGVISQFDKKYLEHLMSYNKALLQRNSLLKLMGTGRSGSGSEVELWNEHLVNHGQYLFEKRKAIMSEITENFNSYYREIGGMEEFVRIDYHSQLNSYESFGEQLLRTADRDLVLQYTSIGIHKDDIEFCIDGRMVRKFASQGQQKTLLLALRLAQASLISKMKGDKPLMLLDDIHDKLDAGRMARLLDILNSDNFGQLFITDTNANHMRDLVRSCGMTPRFFEVERGNVKEMAVKADEMDVYQ